MDNLPPWNYFRFDEEADPADNDEQRGRQIDLNKRRNLNSQIIKGER